MKTIQRIAASLLLVAACVAPAKAETKPEAPSTTLRVMTFNIGHGEDKKINFVPIVEAIRRANPDIVALQEVNQGTGGSFRRNLTTELQVMTGMMIYFTNNSSSVLGGKLGNAVLTRFPILMQTNTYYKTSQTNEQQGIIQMIMDVHGRKVLFMGAQIDCQKDDPRMLLTQIKEIVAQHPGMPVILCGNFNGASNGRVYRQLKKAFADVWPHAGEGKGFTFPSAGPKERMDYIWISPDKTIEPIIAWVPAILATDHRPVVAELRLK